MPELRNRSLFERIKSAVGTARQLETRSPSDFVKRVAANLLVTPEDVKGIAKLPMDLANLNLRFLSNPGEFVKSGAKYALENPPHPTTLASMAVPTGELATYRRITPFIARIYLHHLLGLRTPFNYVTKAEKKQLTSIAQRQIDDILKARASAEKANALAVVKKREVDEYIRTINDYIDENPLVSFEDAKHARRRLEARYKSYISEFGKLGNWKEKTFRKIPSSVLAYRIKRYIGENTVPLSALGDMAKPIVSYNIAKEFTKLGIDPKKIKGIYVEPNVVVPNDITNLYGALGKYFIVPTKVKQKGFIKGNLRNTEKIVPESIKDLYKFYNEVYGYKTGLGQHIIDSSKRIIREFNIEIRAAKREGRPLSKVNQIEYLRNLVIGNVGPEGLVGGTLRRLGMMRSPTIVDIPLIRERPLNAHDKLAILLGADVGRRRINQLKREEEQKQ